MSTLLLLGSLSNGITSNLDATERHYPNELPSFQLFESARWNVIEPLVSTQAEVHEVLGEPEKVFYEDGDDWNLLVPYVGEGSCDGKPWPSFLTGKVDSIQLMPKHRMSMAAVSFPKAFKRTDLNGPHDVPTSWYRYVDQDGLEYHVQSQDSPDGTVHAGDLKMIVYGPSRSTFETLTGCDWPYPKSRDDD